METRRPASYTRLVQRLELLKALGDNTRYAIYLEIARSASPKSTGDIAESLALHANTVRPHLERMREVGLLEVEVDGRGSVGRPQHRYFLAPDAPSLGLEPPAFPTLAGMLAEVAAQALPDPEDTAEVGRSQGRRAARGRSTRSRAERTDAGACVSALLDELTKLGFDPAADVDGDGLTTIAFTHCPYRELAEVYPQLVCNLHRGIVEGFLETGPDVIRVADFRTLADRDPCQVSLTSRYAVSDE